MTDAKIPGWRYRSGTPRSLWQLILYAPKLYSIDSLFWVAIEGIPAIDGLLIGAFFDALTGESWLSTGQAIALLLIATIAHIAVILAGRFTKTQHRFTVSALVRRNLLDRLLHRPGAAPLAVGNRTVSTGEAISYFREDVDQIEDAVAGVSEIAGSGLFALGSFVILLAIDPQITLLVFVPLAVIVLLVQQVQTRIKRYRRASRHATEQVTGMAGEMFNSVQAIKVAGAEDHVLAHFRQINDQRRRVMIRDRLLTALLDSSFQNLVSFGTSLILLVAAQAMRSGRSTLTVGELAMFIYYLGFITSFLTFLGESIALYKQTEVSFERMAALVPADSDALAIVAHQPLYLQPLGDQPPRLPDRTPQDRIPLSELRAENLTYRYPKTGQGITNVSLQLDRGSLTVITGRVGAGKTTLLRVLLGLLPLESGAIYWNDRPIANPAEFFVPPQSAYTPQTPQLFSDSLLQNLLLGWPDDALTEAIDLAVFEADVAAMPKGLQTIVGAKGMRLSGGQLQRAAAARMFVRQPELLVFDDLSSALDIQTELKLWARLFDVAKRSHWQPTYLVVSHRRPILKRADRILVLDRGQVIAAGSYVQLITQPELRQFW
ncbi:ABC transporter ATP-binding protein [Microcoleus sp. FACHB-1515]|uniref:ABC transporter ATP-binding protein n=1 Tax=Cyanophyceae TaxID=3028117 RepID=UPI001685FC39|nr:ABC transporter ATP-binding protein [Microcoleus sp. FACHB-1515]MBD2091496.1 ABC transporter ATP-binding protein [Microcoleus sp. FACHB-1515]